MPTIIEHATAGLTDKERANSLLFYGEHLKPTYAERAVATFGVGADAASICLLSSTAVFKHGASGLFLTDRAVYRSADLYNDTPRHLPYHEIYAAEADKKVLYLNGEPFAKHFANAQAAQLVADIFSAIIAHLKRDHAPRRSKARLGTLQQMRTQGLISEAEYTLARSQVIANQKTL